jgi:hypothetical protein
MFWGLTDPHPDPLVTSTDPDPAPDPSFPNKSVKRTERMVANFNFNTTSFLLKIRFTPSNILLHFINLLNFIYKTL